MSRYIDADALDKRIYNDIPISVFGSIKKMAAVREIIAEQPTVDAVPACRCKDCKYNIGENVWLDGDVTIDCANGMGYPPPNWYCADGERRDG